MFFWSDAQIFVTTGVDNEVKITAKQKKYHKSFEKNFSENFEKTLDKQNEM